MTRASNRASVNKAKAAAMLRALEKPAPKRVRECDSRRVRWQVERARGGRWEQH